MTASEFMGIAPMFASEDGKVRCVLTWDEFNESQKMLRAALSEPPRNCDRFKTAEEALKAQEDAFAEDNFKNGECKLGCPECDNPRIGCKIAWLFANADGGRRP